MGNIKRSISFLALLSVLCIPQKADEYNSSAMPQVKGTAVFIDHETDIFRSAPELASVTEPPIMLATSAIAIDQSSNTILYSLRMDEKLPIASLTKLMTALVVVDKLEMDAIIEVGAEEVRVIGSNMGLVSGERIRVGDLLKAMLIPSSNDAAKTLASAAGGSEENFVRMMNEKAKVLGLASTHFSNPVGLDDPGNYSTCRDLLKLVKEFIKDDRLNAIVATKNERVTSVDGKMRHDLRSTNKLLLENSKVIGIKTGYTSLAKGNLVTRINDEGKDIVTVILNSDEREEDTRKLVNWVTKSYKW